MKIIFTVALIASAGSVEAFEIDPPLSMVVKTRIGLAGACASISELRDMNSALRRRRENRVLALALLTECTVVPDGSVIEMTGAQRDFALGTIVSIPGDGDEPQLGMEVWVDAFDLRSLQGEVGMRVLDSLRPD